jgi:hypothetical protein
MSLSSRREHAANTGIRRAPPPPAPKYRFGKIRAVAFAGRSKTRVDIDWYAEMETQDEAWVEFQSRRCRFRERNLLLPNGCIWNRSKSRIVLRVSRYVRYVVDDDAWDTNDQYFAVSSSGRVVA